MKKIICDKCLTAQPDDENKTIQKFQLRGAGLVQGADLCGDCLTEITASFTPVVVRKRKKKTTKIEPPQKTPPEQS